MKKSLFNPIKLKCKKYKCRKLINIRDKSFFSFFPKTPVSVIIKVIELFILEQKNCIEIIKSLQDFYQVNSVNTKIIYSIVNLVRSAISHYLKEI
jgi:membrane protease subunit (stomatin/prohibitin family)